MRGAKGRGEREWEPQGEEDRERPGVRERRLKISVGSLLDPPQPPGCIRRRTTRSQARARARSKSEFYECVCECMEVCVTLYLYVPPPPVLPELRTCVMFPVHATVLVLSVFCA